MKDIEVITFYQTGGILLIQFVKLPGDAVIFKCSPKIFVKGRLLRFQVIE
jgi:hypothetical protein